MNTITPITTMLRKESSETDIRKQLQKQWQHNNGESIRNDVTEQT